MNMQECIAQGEQYVMNTYKRLPIVLEKGEGCFVWDMDGNKYLDMVAGIAVNGLGHSPKIVVEAIQKQQGTERFGRGFGEKKRLGQNILLQQRRRG